MSSVARITAEIDLKDSLTAPLKQAETNIKRFADRSRDELGRFQISASRAWKEFGDKLDAVSQKAMMVGGALTLGVTLPIVALGKKAVTAASDLQESMTKTEQVFGKATGTITDFAKQSAEKFGTSKKAAMDYASSFGLILQAGGATEKASADMSVALTKLSADLASFFNTDVETAAQKLKSGLVGEAEPLRAFGVLLSETAVKNKALAMGFKETGGQLSEAAKVQARYQIILEQTTKAQNDFSRTSDGLANQGRIVKAMFADLSAEFGEVLLPYVKQGLEYVKGLMERFRALSPAQKEMIVKTAAIAAAIGPLLTVFGALGNAISGIIKAKGLLSGAWGALTRVIASSGGILGAARVALAALTGPIGIIIGLATALYIAWQKNFLGIRDIVEPVLKEIGKWFRDTYDEISVTMSDIVKTVTDWWKEIYPQVKPVIEFLVNYVRQEWMMKLAAIKAVLRFMLDAINVGLGLIQLASGKGWGKLSDATKASFMRIGAMATDFAASIVQAVLSMFKAIFGFIGNIPGIGEGYKFLVDMADDWIKSMKDQAKAGFKLAEGYQAAADKARALKDAQEAAKNSNPFSGGITPRGTTKTGGGGGGKGGGLRPANPFELDPGLKERMAAEKKAAEELKRRMEEVEKIQRALLVEQMKARGERLKDILSVQEFGKAYDKLTDSVNRAKIDAMAELELFRMKLSEEEKATQAKEDAIEKARALNAQVADQIKNYQKEIALIGATTEYEKMLWEVRNGEYAKANPLMKAFLLAQAKQVDQTRQQVEATAKWKEFWQGIVESMKKAREEKEKESNGRYNEYIQELTKKMLELKEGQDAVTRSLLEQQLAGIQNADERKRKLQEILDLMNLVKVTEQRVDQVRKLAQGLEAIFSRAIDNIWNNGFRNLFTNIVDGIRDMVREIASELLKLQARRAVAWLIGAIGGSAAKKDFLSGIGGSATGGMVFAGVPRRVGEAGPELFLPEQNGRIVRRDEMGGGGLVQNISVAIHTPDRVSFRKSDGQTAAIIAARADRARRRDGRG